MKQSITYRQIVSVLLATLVLQVIVLKEFHHYFDHHHHEAKAHCLTNGKETHLHSEEYAPVDCQICFFQFAPATLDFIAFIVKVPLPGNSSGRFAYQQDDNRQVHWHFQLRGPPAFPA